MVDNQHDEVADGYERNNRCVLQRVESSEEGERYDDEHECGNPEMSIKHEWWQCTVILKTSHHSRHQVSNYDQIADTNSEAFDSDRSVEYDGGVGVCDLAEGEEAGRSSFQIVGASRLEVQSEACCRSCP